jgi:hypothetical protein
MKLYYYFAVNDKFFTAATKTFLDSGNTAEFSGMANTKNDFLAAVPYKSISYLSEMQYNDIEIDYNYLLEVESKYNVCLADLINMERHFWHLTKSQRMGYALQIIRRIEADYSELKFDVIFSSGLSDFASYFLYSFAKTIGIPFYYFITNRMGTTVYLSDRADTGPANLDKSFKKYIDDHKKLPADFESVKNLVASYVANKKQPSYITNSTMLYRVFSFYDVQVFLASLLKYYKGEKAFHSYESPLKLMFNRGVKIIRKKKYDRYFKNKFIDFKELVGKRYFIYPLHFHPEAATLVQGRWIHDQRAIIEMISKALPVDIKLIIKEHTVSIGRRPLDFYQIIDKLHNVQFISEKTGVYPLIENSLGIVTISSSMGLEAVMLNKPVISFGDIHYNLLTDVIKATDISKMKDYVNQALNFVKYDEGEYLAFFKAITENNYEMPGYSPHNFSEDNINTMALILKDISK